MRGNFTNRPEPALMKCLNRLGYAIGIRRTPAAGSVGRLVPALPALAWAARSIGNRRPRNAHALPMGPVGACYLDSENGSSFSSRAPSSPGRRPWSEYKMHSIFTRQIIDDNSNNH